LTRVIGAAFHCERRALVFERDMRLLGTGISYSFLKLSNPLQRESMLAS
jgi:hypothetical protein